HLGGKPVPGVDYNDDQKLRYWIRDNVIDIDLAGSVMPPPEAVAAGKVRPLSGEDRRTLVRWIDLGCPIDLDPDYDPTNPESRISGWMGDAQRPPLPLPRPAAGPNPPVTRILVGMADAYSGLDRTSFHVTADFPVDGVPAGTDLAPKFKVK